MKAILGAAVFLLVSFNLMAQDIHFSQFNSSPLNINPAFAGLFNGNARIVANHRTQWSAVTVPYKTFSASFDMNYQPERKRNILGFGLLVNTDKAGDSDFGTLEFSPTLAYSMSLSRVKKEYITYGMQLGLAQRSINYSNLIFDSQYEGGKFDPTASSGEAFVGDRIFFWDAAAGINYYSELTKDLTISTGAAIHHFNKPKVSFRNSGDVILSSRHTFHASADYKVNSDYSIMPGFIFLQQYKFTEVTAGGNVKFPLEAGNFLYFGAWTRLKDKDALILSTRLDQNNVSVGLSYDVNFSQLSAASHYRGAYEISLMYIFKNDKYTRLKKLPCPTFI